METSSLERELICPICQDYFTTPLSLPCQHNVCHRCAKEQVLSLATTDDRQEHSSSESLNNATSPTNSVASLPVTPSQPLSRSNSRSSFRRRSTVSGPPSATGTPGRTLSRQTVSPVSSPRGTGITSPKGKSGTFLARVHATKFFCPSCRENVELGEKGLNGLYRNFALEVIVDRFKLAAKKAASIPCGLCKVKPPLDATKSCLDCKVSYCNECYKNFHVWGTSRAQHEHIGQPHNFRPKTITCTEHLTEKVTMYCDGCQKLVCHKCKISGTHAKHKMSVIERKYTIVKETLESYLAAIRGKRAAIRDSVDALNGLSGKIEENGGIARDQLATSLSSLQATLADRSANLSQATEVEIGRRVEAVQTQLQSYQEILKGCSVVDLVQEMLKETDQACFVQAARSILDRLIKTVKVIEEAELSPVHAYHDFNNFTIDNEGALRALTYLSFNKAPYAASISAKRCQSYNHVTVEWDPPTGDYQAETYRLEYRKMIRNDGVTKPSTPTTPSRENTFSSRSDTGSEDLWTSVEEIKQCRFVLTDLEPESRYKVRVRGENKAGKGEYSKSVVIRTVPAPVLSFKWTPCQPNGTHGPSISKDGSRVNVRPNHLFSPFSGPIPPITLSPAFCLGDRKLTNGRHYWEVIVDQSPCAVQIGVISERRSRRLGDPISSHTDGDSGHDSCEELETDRGSPTDPTVLINYYGGKIFLPGESTKNNKKAGSNGNKHTVHTLTSCAVGVCVEVDKGRVSFFDGENKESFYSVNVKLEGAVYPGIVVVGPGVVKLRHLEENEKIV